MPEEEEKVEGDEIAEEAAPEAEAETPADAAPEETEA